MTDPKSVQNGGKAPVLFTYDFLQLEDTLLNHARRFEDYESTVERFGGVDMSRYVSADCGHVAADSEPEACEELFYRYNMDRPEGYRGRSMSVSDVVILYNENENPTAKTVWFCDSIGFRKLEG